MHARFFDHARSSRTRATVLGCLAFRYTDSVGIRNQFSIAAHWLACTFPCRRFAETLTDLCARLGADVVRYSFIVGDLHPLLLAGLPAHPCKNSFRSPRRMTNRRIRCDESPEIASTWLKSTPENGSRTLLHSLGHKPPLTRRR